MFMATASSITTTPMPPEMLLFSSRAPRVCVGGAWEGSCVCVCVCMRVCGLVRGWVGEGSIMP
jgi:hypothetical protein